MKYSDTYTNGVIALGMYHNSTWVKAQHHSYEQWVQLVWPTTPVVSWLDYTGIDNLLRGLASLRFKT